jgi:hypothetical protein
MARPAKRLAIPVDPTIIGSPVDAVDIVPGNPNHQSLLTSHSRASGLAGVVLPLQLNLNLLPHRLDLPALPGKSSLYCAGNTDAGCVLTTGGGFHLPVSAWDFGA